MEAKLSTLQKKTQKELQEKKKLYLLQKEKVDAIQMKLDDIDNMRHFIERNGYKQFIGRIKFSYVLLYNLKVCLMRYYSNLI